MSESGCGLVWVLLSCGSAGQVLHRVDGFAVHADFEMQFDAVCVAIAHGGNRLACCDFLVFLNQNGVVVCVGGDGEVAVADENQFAVAAHFFADVEDGSGCCGFDALSECASNIDAFVGRVVVATDDGIFAVVDRPLQGQAVDGGDGSGAADVGTAGTGAVGGVFTDAQDLSDFDL